MRDRLGFERGTCATCAANGNECIEFTYVVDDEESDEEDMYSLSEEAYRRNPLLPGLKRRLANVEADEKLGQGSTWSRASPCCGTCGCTAEEHEVVQVTEPEAGMLEVARQLFEPFDITLLIQQSVQDTACLGLGRDGFTYGEVGLLSFLQLLHRVSTIQGRTMHQGRSGVFYDLGCGAGKAVVLAALHPIGFQRCVGVELLPGLAAAACCLGKRFADANLAEVAEVRFTEGDMEKVPLLDAALVLLNAGSWREPSLSRIRLRLTEVLPDGCILATIRKPLAKTGCSELVQLEEMQLPMSWGEAPVYLAQRRRGLRDSPQVPVLFDLNALD